MVSLDMSFHIKFMVSLDMKFFIMVYFFSKSFIENPISGFTVFYKGYLIQNIQKIGYRYVLLYNFENVRYEDKNFPVRVYFSYIY
jgi:hypothetical protein